MAAPIEQPAKPAASIGSANWHPPHIAVLNGASSGLRLIDAATTFVIAKPNWSSISDVDRSTYDHDDFALEYDRYATFGRGAFGKTR